jgi:hypothetical protein
MDELFPIGTGILLGLAFASKVRSLRLLWVRVTVVLVAGIAATVLSGEYKENWGFALVDIGEVALAAWVATAFARLVARRIHHGVRAGRRRPIG